MTRSLSLKITSLLFCFVFLASACTPNIQHQGPKIQNQVPATAILKVGDQTTFNQVPYQFDASGNVWIPLKQAVESLDFNHEWDSQEGTFSVGYKDILYQVRMNRQQAISEERTIQLPIAPKRIGQEPYMSLNSLETLWNTDITWDQTSKTAWIKPLVDERENRTGTSVQTEDGGAHLLALKSINESDLLQYANRFKGVPYKFGASPYPRSKRFDCSSFTQYVFGKFGVKLPRTARAQAIKGYRVSYTNLQPGDLVFFYVPGRFNTNRIVGHCGIYIGNGKFIHTYGKPGVTISSLRSGYWKNTYMSARRVAE